MFTVGEFAVCPGHGVGRICEIEEKKIGNGSKSYYILKLSSNGMKVMVPLDKSNGIRKLASDQEISEVFSLLSDHCITIDTSTWNRRYRDYMLKIRTGSLLQIADVLRSLYLLKNKKGLSFGEKKMLNHCQDLLVQEISLSKGDDRKIILKRIENCF